MSVCLFCAQKHRRGLLILKHLTSVPPLVRNCGVVHRELIITFKRTGDLTLEELTRSSYYTGGKQALHPRTVQEDSKSHSALDLSWRTSVLFDEQQSAITHAADELDF